MKSKKEIQDKIDELTPLFEMSENLYFQSIKEKQNGLNINIVDFIKIEFDYEILKKEIKSLEWVLKK